MSDTGAHGHPRGVEEVPPGSTTHQLAALATELNGSGRVVDLAALDPAGLLGVGRDESVDELLAAIPAAEVLVLVTPIYRATYSGLLKVVLDQLPQSALLCKWARLWGTKAAG